MTLFDEDTPIITPTWTREFWLLDPGPFIDIAFDLGMSQFVFRSQYHEAPGVRQDFTKYIDIYSRGREWRVIWVPYPGDWAVLFTDKRGWKQHEAVWPIWRAKTEPLKKLAHLFENPQPAGTIIGHWGVASRSASTPVDVVDGQPHRVLMAAMPHPEGQWAEVATFAQQLQATNPETTLHCHGQKSVGRTIGIAAKSFDHPVRLGWDDGFPRILLPNGMLWCTHSAPTPHQENWLRVVGSSSREVRGLDRKKLARKVYEINLKSLRWAFMNWDRAWDFRRARADEEDIDSADLDWSPKTLPIRLRKTKHERMELDRWLCDTCSLQFRCPYSREGSVCIVPDSEPVELAANFKTRNAALIVETLGNILSADAQRAQRALRQELDVIDHIESDPEAKPTIVLSPELSKLMKTLFDRGVVLAKLLDPQLASQMGSGVNVNLNIGAGGAPPTSQAIHRYVAAQLEARGISLEDATPDLIQSILAESVPRSRAIEANGREF